MIIKGIVNSLRAISMKDTMLMHYSVLKVVHCANLEFFHVCNFALKWHFHAYSYIYLISSQSLNLGSHWGTTDDVATIPFHPSLSSAALRESPNPIPVRGARWLSGRVSDSGARGRGFETYRRRVVSLSKTLYSPKVLVNYPGSGGSIPTWLKNCWLGR